MSSPPHPRPGEGNGTPLQYSCLENPSDGGAWWAAVHGVPRSRTRLSDFTFTFHFPALEKEMATHSSVLAWRIPGTGEPGGLPSMGVAQSRTRLKQLSSSSSSRPPPEPPSSRGHHPPSGGLPQPPLPRLPASTLYEPSSSEAGAPTERLTPPCHPRTLP